MNAPLSDPLALMDHSSLLSESERDIQSTVAGFLADRVRTSVAEWFDSGIFPRELVPELGKLGLLGMHLEGYGCSGTSAVEYGLAYMELEAVDSVLRSFVSVQGSLSMFSSWRFGSEEQKQEWLPRLAAGEAIGCFGLTEPDHGSDPANMRTRAVRDGDDWILNGTKMWITNGGIADIATVWARTEEGIRGFLIPRDTLGFATRDIKHKLSLRASTTSELILDDVRLPDSARLPLAEGLRGPLSCLNEARFGILFGAVGSARDCVQAAVGYAVTPNPVRQAYRGLPADAAETGRPCARDEHQRPARAAHRTAQGRRHAATGADQRRQTQQRSRGNYTTARECRTILGGSGITTEYSPLRHAVNLESVLSYEGTSEIHPLTVGRALTGLSAFAG